MALAAILDDDLQRVGVVAFGAGVEGANVLVEAGVFPVGELVSALDLGAEQRGPGGEVVDIEEAQVLADLISCLLYTSDAADE